MLSNSVESFKNGFRIFLSVISLPLIFLIGLVGLVLLILIPWVIWASLSTGGLYKLEQINPDYPHPNKNVAFLINKLNNSTFDTFDRFHVKQCWPYMPNWSKAKECVEIRISCQSISPKDKKYPWPDVFSDDFRTCFENKRPSVGFYEIMHVSRTLFRSYVIVGILKVTNEESLSNWESKKWWKRPLHDWLERGE